MAKSIFEQTMDKFDLNLKNEERGSDLGWYEGYITALANHDLITETQFDDIMSRLAHWKEYND